MAAFLPAVNPEGPPVAQPRSLVPRCGPCIPRSRPFKGDGVSYAFYVLKALPEIIFHLYVYVCLYVYFELELCQWSEKMLLFYDNQKY